MAVVVASSVISPAGSSPSELWERCHQGNSLSQHGLAAISNETVLHLLDQLKRRELYSCDPYYFRNHIITLAALERCLAEANWSLTDEDGLILGTTTGAISCWEPAFLDFHRQKMGQQELAKHLIYQRPSYFIEDIANYFNFNGQRVVLSTACSASTQALEMATNWLKLGRVKRCIVGGVDFLSQLTTRGFDSLKLVSKEQCRPFDQERTGIHLSEAAAFVALQLKGDGDIHLKSVSSSLDAYHMTRPHPEGEGCYQSICKSLAEANLNKSDIDWIHSHGTGSLANDLAEAKAIVRAFGRETPLITSTKSIHAHTLGASGVFEAVIDRECLKRQSILPNHFLKNIDPKIEGNFATLSNYKKTKKIKNILKTTVGFGGTNAAFIMSKD